MGTHIYMCGLKGMESGMEECFGPLPGIADDVGAVERVQLVQLPWGAPLASHNMASFSMSFFVSGKLLMRRCLACGVAHAGAALAVDSSLGSFSGHAASSP